ncbi:alkaline shock response membrane anchor protein AmaP [Streptomyces litchfieldiae]|uniref:Alkaline shock response membrane anchor protein AmaP n=1 Tax=Streptomyces litchfieldiae TaxID=3075543 RepID=A0ABU2MTA3_9ACTN|nr:alkaline shock response membrane anchor protein AmaP [Streptomyces sp. DSM 44938]MDT0344867.1 alkaline shock response membrane anchor protein AmaP [Streptomyces sp. DSM 44938]
MLRIVNRVLLVLTGLFLFGVGLVAVVAALDLPRRWGFSMPSGWSWRSPRDVLLTRADRVQWRDEGWWWPVVIGGLSLLVLLALWWLLAQLRRQRLAEVLVDSGDGVGALLRGRAMEEVVAAEAESLPGIDRARVTLVGRRGQPRLRVGLLLTPQARPDEVVRRLRTEAVEHARASAGLEALPAEARLRSARHEVERVS